MLVYRTAEFDQRASDFQLENNVEELIYAVAAAEDAEHVRKRMQFKAYHGTPYFKYRSGKKRILSRFRQVGNEEVFCFLSIMDRKGHEYGRFLADMDTYGKRHLDPLIEDNDLHETVSEQREARRRSHLIFSQPPPLPETLAPWLDHPDWRDGAKDDTLIYESDEWVRRFAAKEYMEFWSDFRALVESQIDKDAVAEPCEGWPGVFLAADDRAKRHILFYRHLAVGTPPCPVILLLAPFVSKPDSAELNEVLRFLRLPQEPVDHDKLAACAKRAYLAELTDKEYEEIWKDIQKDAEANLALSGEELNLLRYVSRPPGNESGLPLFIDGRAGSGKTTLLIYLFAEYCHRKRSLGLPGDPLYLTYNKRLLTVASDATEKLLKSDSRFRQGKPRLTLKLENYFRPFREFLRNLLPANQRQKFEMSKFISFPLFKQLYEGDELPADASVPQGLYLRLKEREKFSAELCWYVIRIFIKGNDRDGFLDPEEYHEDVPDKERTVDQAVFTAIHDSIWERWYHSRVMGEGWWDDQDLVRAALEVVLTERRLAMRQARGEVVERSATSLRTYTAIFCDEAQDFTRLELQLLMRLSQLSMYDLGRRAHISLPFAFAGDPFQTLNPTGFRWKSLESSFHEEILSALDPAARLSVKVRHKSLEWNYRSQPAIVKLTNLILLWRRVLFDLPEINPQPWWQCQEAPGPILFLLEDNLFVEDLKKYASETIIIVPCEEGQEADYVKNDCHLADIFAQDIRTAEEMQRMAKDEDEKKKAAFVPKNVLSATLAKGLQFNRVILYKFGEHCDAAWLDESATTSMDAEYYFNKLYVGASRAVQRLFVIDSSEGDKRLWRRVCSPEAQDTFLRRAEGSNFKQEYLGELPLADRAMASELKETDPKANAEVLWTKGKREGNPIWLRRARDFYNSINESRQAALCEAWALRLEKKFCEAGNMFRSCHEDDEARQAYWDGACWKQLAEFHTISSLEMPCELAEFMTSNFSQVAVLFSEFLHERLGTKDGRSFTRADSKAWSECIAALAGRLLAQPKSSFNTEEWRRFALVLSILDREEFTGLAEAICHCFVQAERWDKAEEWLKPCGQDVHRRYYRARAQQTTSPANLRWLELANDYEQIVIEWEKAGKPLTSREWLDPVIRSLERFNRFRDLAAIYRVLNQLTQARQHFKSAWEKCPPQEKPDELREYVDFLGRNGRWRDLLDALNEYLPGTVPDLPVRCRVIGILAELPNDPPPSELLVLGQSYAQFIEQTINMLGWEEQVSVLTVGAAFERTRRYVSTLSYYENHVESTTPELRSQARERWLIVKGWQEEYHRNERNVSMADVSRSEREKKRKAWAQDFVPEVDGLPPGVVPVEVQDGSRLQLNNRLLVKLIRSRRTVRIEDTQTQEELRIDFRQERVTTEDPNITLSETARNWSFENQECGYTGRVLFSSDTPQLELQVKGTDNPILVRFRQR